MPEHRGAFILVRLHRVMFPFLQESDRNAEKPHMGERSLDLAWHGRVALDVFILLCLTPPDPQSSLELFRNVNPIESIGI